MLIWISADATRDEDSENIYEKILKKYSLKKKCTVLDPLSGNLGIVCFGIFFSLNLMFFF